MNGCCYIVAAKRLGAVVGGVLGCLATAMVAAADQAVSTGAAVSAAPAIADNGMSMFSSGIRMIGGLCFCLGIFALVVRLMRRFSGVGGTAHRRRIEVREKMTLSSKASIFLIAVDNREYLIAQGSDSVSVTPTHSMTTPLFTESLEEVCAEVGDLHA
jgi:flagellar biogenesis protein FliO